MCETGLDRKILARNICSFCPWPGNGELLWMVGLERDGVMVDGGVWFEGLVRPQAMGW